MLRGLRDGCIVPRSHSISIYAIQTSLFRVGATLLLCAFLSTSCSDDDGPKGTRDTLASFRVPEEHDRFVVYNFEKGTIHGFVFVSDAQGNVLTAKEFHPNETLELIPDKPFDGDEVTPTEVYIERDSDTDQYVMRATSYTQLLRGTSWPAEVYGKSGVITPPAGKVDVILRDETQGELVTQYILAAMSIGRMSGPETRNFLSLRQLLYV